MHAANKKGQAAFFPAAWPPPLPFGCHVKIIVNPVKQLPLPGHSGFVLKCQWLLGANGKLRMAWTRVALYTKSTRQA